MISLLRIACITNAIAWVQLITSSKRKQKPKSVTTNGITVFTCYCQWHYKQKRKKLSLRKGMALSCLLLSLPLLCLSVSPSSGHSLSPFAIMQLVARLTSLFFSFPLRSLSYLFFCHFFSPSLPSVCGFQGDSQAGERASMFFKKKAKREKRKKWIEGRDHEWPTMCLKILAYIHTATCSGPGILILSERGRVQQQEREKVLIVGFLRCQK